MSLCFIAVLPFRSSQCSMFTPDLQEYHHSPGLCFGSIVIPAFPTTHTRPKVQIYSVVKLSWPLVFLISRYIYFDYFHLNIFYLFFSLFLPLLLYTIIYLNFANLCLFVSLLFGILPPNHFCILLFVIWKCVWMEFTMCNLLDADWITEIGVDWEMGMEKQDKNNDINKS